MNRLEQKLPVVYLKSGEMHFAERPTLIVTVLGSCLSVVMFSRRKGLGGICHGFLPCCKDSNNCCNGGCREKFKYVDCSVRHMVKLFDQHDVKRSELEVKCFGGSDLFAAHSKMPGAVSVGKQNIQTAEKIIGSEGLSILTMDVGGPQGRKIFFYTETGEVILKRLTKMNDPVVK